MLIRKAFSAGLTGAALCMADMSGMVTDTSGTIPLAGALVQLEKGHQAVVTGADGRFKLVVASSVLSESFILPKSNLSAVIEDGILYVNLAHRSNVEVAAVDLSGRILSKIRLALNAGESRVTLPRTGEGVYVYKIKSIGAEIVIRSYAGAQGRQGTRMTDVHTVMAKRSGSFNDVISVTMPGYLNYQVMATNPDTAGIEIRMIACIDTMKDADGNLYHVVKIGNQLWTVENLRSTKFNDNTPITFEPAENNWDSVPSPKYCYYPNIENAASRAKFGAMYNGYAVITGKLAPQGWHVPTNGDWDTLQNFLIGHGYNWDGSTTENRIAKSLAAKTDWTDLHHQYCWGAIGCEFAKNNKTGFSAIPAGGRNLAGVFDFMGLYGCWWSITEQNEKFEYLRFVINSKENLNSTIDNKRAFFSVRLVHD